MPCYAFEGVRPVVHPTAFVHPTAVLIGDVHVGDGCLVGPHASLRGDIGRLVMKAGSNVQDGCVVHVFPGRQCTIEEDGHVGHGAVLHGCTIGRNAMVGMNAVIMDDAVIGEEAFVAAMAFVKGREEVPPRTLVAGAPAKVVRELRDEEIGWKTEGTRIYQHLARRYRATMQEVAPLPAAEADRPTLPDVMYETKRARDERGAQPARDERGAG